MENGLGIKNGFCCAKTCVKLEARILAVAVASAVRAAHGRSLLVIPAAALLVNLGDGTSSS